MKKILRTMFVLAAALAVPGAMASGIAFITNLKGEVAVDGTPRPLLMSELAKGQKIVVGKDSAASVMYLQSGKEYALKVPGEYVVGEREISAPTGVPPVSRETAWRASGPVLVKVSQASSASIRMRSMAPPKAEAKPRLEAPVQGAVATLQPTLRWTGTDGKGPADVVLAVAGKEDKPVAKARVTASAWRAPAKLQPGVEYAWSVSQGGLELGSARFRTLDSGAIQAIEKSRPGDKAEFSDRLLFALLLQEHGAIQEAQEAWSRLAQERTDLPELAGLAR